MSEVQDQVKTVPRVKVTITFPERLWKLVEQIAADEGVTRTEVLRRAISLEKLRRDVVKEGGSLIVVKHDGSQERLYFPY
jgi:hypothetical protein